MTKYSPLQMHRNKLRLASNYFQKKQDECSMNLMSTCNLSSREAENLIKKIDGLESRLKALEEEHQQHQSSFLSASTSSSFSEEEHEQKVMATTKGAENFLR